MVKSLLDEARSAPLDEAGRIRLREIYETSIRELASALSPDLGGELSRMSPPFSIDVPTERGGNKAAAAQLEKMRDRSLNPGGPETRAGTYL